MPAGQHVNNSPRNFFTLVGLLLCLSLYAQKPSEYRSINFKDSYISSKWFGPYAFPVPDQLEGRTCNTLLVTLGGDYTIGSLAGNAPELRDYTQAVTFAVRLPLWTDRVNLSAWGEFHEWYQDSPQVRELRGVYPSYPLSGHDAGNTYLSVDILPLREGRWHPSVALRVATLFATGDDYEKARHFDTPGYFLDISTGKSFAFGGSSSFRVSASVGFVCWQVSPGRQNDALMYGGKVSYSHSFATFGVELGGYNGREADGDAPLTLKSRLDVHLGCFSPFFAYAHGFHDWPFDQFRAGLAVSIKAVSFYR